MVNIWDYANERPRVRLTTKEKDTFIGNVLMVYDALETDDDQDSIAIEMDDGEIIRFFQAEILSIDVLT